MERNADGANVAVARASEIRNIVDAPTRRVATHTGEEHLALASIVDGV